MMGRCRHASWFVARAWIAGFAVLGASCAAARGPAARASNLCGDLTEPARRERCFDEAADRRTIDPGGALTRLVEVCEAGMVDACTEAARLAFERPDVSSATGVRERAGAWCEAGGPAAASATREALGRTCSFAARIRAEMAPADLPRAHSLWQRACNSEGLVAACLVLVHGFGEAVDTSRIVAAHQSSEDQQRHAEAAWSHAAALTPSHAPRPRDWLPNGFTGNAAVAASWLRLGWDPATFQSVAGSARPPAAATSAPTDRVETAGVTCDSCPARCEALTRQCRAGDGRVCAPAAACVCLCEGAAGGCALPRWALTSCVSMNAPLHE